MEESVEGVLIENNEECRPFPCIHQYGHTALPVEHGLNFIRLLYLRPKCSCLDSRSDHRALPPDPIPQFDLKVVALENAPEYEAVSYTWGCPDLIRKVLVGSRFMTVTENCYQTLCRLQPRCTASVGQCTAHPRSLWIDAICIDQVSIEERNKQVRLMSTIYTQAREVLLWAGSLNKGLEEPHLLENASEETAKPSKLLEWINKPYFDRMWPVQEVALSRSCLILVGEDHSIDLETLIDNPQLVVDGMEVCGNLYPVLDAIERRMRLHRRLWVEFRHVHKGRGVAPTNPPRISQVLLDTRSLKASEPRDKIFALQGMFEALSIRMSAPDYTKSVEDIYSEAAIAAINYDQDLAILGGLDSDKSIQLPSWVPDFSIGHRSNNITNYIYGDATRGSNVHFNIEFADRTLSLRGQPLDVVDRVITEFPDLHVLRNRDMLECFVPNCIDDQDLYAAFIGSLLYSFPFNVSRDVGLLLPICRNPEARSTLDHLTSSKNYAPLHKAMRDVFSRKKVFITRDRRLGLVSSHNLLGGDHIILLAACCYPMVVRRDCYQWAMVAPAHVGSTVADGS